MPAQPMTVTLILETTRDDAGVSLRLRTAGEARTLLCQPIAFDEVLAAMAALDGGVLEGNEDRWPSPDVLQLERALRLDPVRTALRDVAPTAQGRVRLLVTDEGPLPATLPWELLRLSGDLPAGLDPILRVVRVAPRPTAPRPVAPASETALLAWADPASRRVGGLASVPSEARAVMAGACASAAGASTWRELPHATPSSLERALREARPALFHFIGHGEAVPSGARLVLEGSRPGEEDCVYPEELAGWLASAGVCLTVLCACRSGANGGFGAACAKAGVSAAVAMQGTLRDAAGPLLARALYSAIAAGESVEDALWEARQALRSSGMDWAMPVLWSAGMAPVAPPAVVWPAARASAPTNLPFKRSAVFVGREEMLQSIDRMLAEAPERPLAICGMAGVGKTQIAVEYAHRRREAYPGGVYWLDARDTACLLEQYASIGGLLGIQGPIEDEAERARRARAALQSVSQPALVVLDNITEATDLSLLPDPGGVRVLLTARDPSLVRPVCAVIEPPGLDKEDALRLLEEPAPARTPADRLAMEEIAAMVDGLPLALALAAHYARRLGVGYTEVRDRLRRDTVDTLEQARRRFVAATGHTGALFEVIEIARRELPAGASRVLEVAACTAGRSTDPTLLAECLEAADAGSLPDRIAELVDAGLVQRDQTGRLRVHSLVRTCVLSRTDTDARRHAIARLSDALERRLAAANRVMAWPTIRPDMPDVRRALELAAEEELPLAREALLFEYGLYLCEQGQSRAAEEALREGKRLCEARPAPDRMRCAEYARRLAEAAMRSGERDEPLTLARAALEAAENALGGDAPETVQFRITMGLVLKMSGYADEALGHYVRALALCEAGADPDGRATATCLNNIGTLLEAKGRPEEALSYLQRALEADERLCGPDHPRVAIRLNNIGRVRRGLGQAEDALDAHRRAIEIYDAAYGPEQRDSAMSRLYAGEALFELGRLDEAHALLREAAETLERTIGPAHSGTQRARALLSMFDPSPSPHADLAHEGSGAL